MRQVTSRLALLAAVPLLSAPAFAQTAQQPLHKTAPRTAPVVAFEGAAETVQLDEIVVSANRMALPISRTGVSISLLSAEDIEKAGDIQLAPLLTRLPGVNLVQNGPLGTATSLRVRGAEPRHTATYVDGIRVDDPTLLTTEFDYGALTTIDIGQIELLRGSQSALWGSSAMGGVVNLSTRRAEKMGLSQEAVLEAGSYGTVKGRYSFGHRTERAELSFNLSHVRSDGFSAYDTLPRTEGAEADGFRANRVSVTGRVQLSESLAIGMAGFTQNSRVNYDDFGADAAGNFDRRSETGGRVFAEYEMGNTVHSLSLSRYQISRGIHAGFTQTDRYDGARTALSYQGTTEFSPSLSFVYGADNTLETGRVEANPGNQSSRIVGVFGQAFWTPREGLDVSLTLRRDENSEFGSQPSGRLAVAYQATSDLTLRGALATGYLSPSLNHRFGNPQWGAAPNFNLTPEKSKSFEIGADYRFGAGASISVTAFRIETDNAIDWCGRVADMWGTPACIGTVPAGFSNMYENKAGITRRKGIELAAVLPLGEKVVGNLAYSYIDARQPSGARVNNVPRHSLTLGADVQLGEALTASVSLQTLAGRTGTMPSYAVLNAGMSYQLTQDTALTLRAENLLDREYQIVRGYGTPARSVYIGVKHSF